MNTKIRKITLTGLLIAVSVVGSSALIIPVFGSKCAPVQHMVNVLAAVLVGPIYGVLAAFIASLLRNLMGTGSLLAFPGSMFGALLCGLMYRYSKNITLTMIAEVFGTAILGGLSAYPIAILLMGKDLTNMAFYMFVLPFLISTAAGALIAGAIVKALQSTGVIERIILGNE